VETSSSVGYSPGPLLQNGVGVRGVDGGREGEEEGGTLCRKMTKVQDVTGDKNVVSMRRVKWFRIAGWMGVGS
jgi:hypothetical protein